MHFLFNHLSSIDNELDQTSTDISVNSNQLKSHFAALPTLQIDE